MSDWAILLIILSPFVIAFVFALVIYKRKSPKLDKPLNLGRLWFQLLNSSFTVRQAVVVLLLFIPYTIWSGIFPGFFVFPIILIAIAYFLYRLANRESKLSDESKEVLDALNEMVSKVGESRLHVEHLANLVRTKQLEIEQKEKIRTELETQIGEKSREKEAWDNLTQKQQELVIQAIKKSQSKNVVVNISIILGSLSLNIIATVIWTLLGNPGRDELIKRFNDFTKLFQP